MWSQNVKRTGLQKNQILIFTQFQSQKLHIFLQEHNTVFIYEEKYAQGNFFQKIFFDSRLLAASS